jgi:hypothetical protein
MRNKVKQRAGLVVAQFEREGDLMGFLPFAARVNPS